MEIISLEPYEPDEVFGKSGLPRSGGIHLTDLVDHILVSQGTKYKDSDWDKSSLFEAGFTWEQVLEDGFRARREPVLRLEEITLDGVAGSPDGYDFRNSELYEYKLTYKSQGKFALSEQYRWLMQGKGYLKMLSEPENPVRRINWIVFFVMGDYRGSGPRCVRYTVEFTDMEIEDNWRMLMNAKKEYEADG